MSDSPFIQNVSIENFLQVVIEGSKSVPVLVDFWADWCQPCKTLMPILAKLAEEYQGAFMLAKVDTEANQEIAMQLGIRSLPTVKLFIDGQPVAEFTGAQPESEVRAFLNKYVKTVEDVEPLSLLEQAMAMVDAGDTPAANSLINRELEKNPQNAQAWLALAQLALAGGEYDKVGTALDKLSEQERNKPEAARIAGLLKFSETADPDTDFNALRKSVDSDSIDSQGRYQYAIHNLLQGSSEQALQQLLLLLQRAPDWNDGEAQKSLIAVFDVLGTDPLVARYRRKMFNLLH